MKLCLQLPLKKEKNKTQEFDNLDVTSQQIINILEEYVKPAVAADGGNIVLILITKR
jgi:Fe-S cluster biogenesis protein NfuA